jgi:hypothetical protein
MKGKETGVHEHRERERERERDKTAFVTIF